MGETCKTALIRREICMGRNDDNCWQSEREEHQVCVQNSPRVKETLQRALQEKCKPFRRGLGLHALSYKEAWLCEWRKK